MIKDQGWVAQALGRHRPVGTPRAEESGEGEGKNEQENRVHLALSPSAGRASFKVPTINLE